MRARYIIGLEGNIDPNDRGIAYGDGLFETMSVHGGIVRRLALHLDRLALGCDRLELPFPDPTELKQQIARASDGIDRGSVKLIMTRGIGPRGYRPPAVPVPTVILLAEAGSVTDVSTLDLAMLDGRLGENEKLAGIKHLNRLEQVLARLELSHLDADEGVMLSTRGIVVGGTSRNLFAVFGDSIKTPAIVRAGIAGVMRRTVLDICAEMHIAVQECELSPADLHRADEIFMTNALVGVQSAARLDQTRFSSQTMASLLRQALEASENGPVGHG